MGDRKEGLGEVESRLSIRIEKSVYLVAAPSPPIGPESTPSDPRAVRFFLKREYFLTVFSLLTKSLRDTSFSSSLSFSPFSSFVWNELLTMSSSNSSPPSSPIALADVLENMI